MKRDDLFETLAEAMKPCSLEETNKKPYTCPVCNGNGLVPNGFYLQTSGAWTTSSVAPEKCRSCNGTGIVWQNIHK